MAQLPAGDPLGGTTDPEGNYSIDVPGENRYLVSYFQSRSANVVPDIPDDIPMIYLIEDLNLGHSSKDLGTIELPEAHRVRIKVIDQSGDPVPDAGVEIRHEGGVAPPPGTFTTNQSGYVKHSGADQHGIDLAGPAEIDVWPPDESIDGPPPIARQAIVDEPMEITIRLNGDFQTEASVQTGQSEAANSDLDSGQPDPQRGFFSNSPENEPGFLSNVFNLTILGFLLSVAGIIHQLVQGD